MTLPTENLAQIRRSSRQNVPTWRGKQYCNERNQDRHLFPSVGDDINVKCILCGRVIWWQATLISIEASPDRQCAENIIHHKRGSYNPVKAVVKFTHSNSHPPQRFVTSVDSPSGGTPEPSSWCYPDEIPINDEESNACLLYTSPSPRDQRGSRMPSSA